MTSQRDIIEAMMKPWTYEEKPGHIELCQTHISLVFLTSKHVYKVKKSVNFGFLDFSTLEKRRHFCEKELVLNRRLCPEIYHEVVSINENAEIKINCKGKAVEYAVKMKRLPQDKIMTRLLAEGKVDIGTVCRIAQVIVDFHEKAETSESISEFGSLETIDTNWLENFNQTEEYVGKTLTDEEFNKIRENVENFMIENRSLFEKRVKEGKIRDCHGDIHSGNIFIADKIYIFDAIEFNDRFRYSDVVSDIAFLAMDLEFKDRQDLSEAFVEMYVQCSGDVELRRLLSFYKCYRAYVRGKVVGFRLNDANIGAVEKMEAVEEAKAYFKLATLYALKLRTKQ